MKKIIIVLLFLGFTIPCFADAQVYVKADANIAKKPAVDAVAITEKMKTDILKLDEITVQKVKAIVQGSSSDAKRAIDIMLKEGTIKTYEERYNELYPTAEVIGP